MWQVIVRILKSHMQAFIHLALILYGLYYATMAISLSHRERPRNFLPQVLVTCVAKYPDALKGLIPPGFTNHSEIKNPYFLHMHIIKSDLGYFQRLLMLQHPFRCITSKRVGLVFPQGVTGYQPVLLWILPPFRGGVYCLAHEIVTLRQYHMSCRKLWFLQFRRFIRRISKPYISKIAYRKGILFLKTTVRLRPCTLIRCSTHGCI